MTQAKEPATDADLVSVRVFGALRELAGRGPLRVAAEEVRTVDGLLAWLDKKEPKLATALQAGLRDGYLNILVNGRNVRFLDGRTTSLAARDAVAFLPPIGGG